MITLSGPALLDEKELEPHSKSLKQYEITYQTNDIDIRCPHDLCIGGRPSHYPAISYNKFHRQVIRDIVSGIGPAKLTVLSQRWYCRTCQSTFTDPACPYKNGNLEYTEDYREFVFQRYLSDWNLKEKDVLEQYDLSKHAFESILQYYKKAHRVADRKMPPCSEIWLYSFIYRDQERIFAIGEVSEDLYVGSNKIKKVLLGFCQDGSFSTAISKFHLDRDGHRPYLIYVNTESLCTQVTQSGYDAILLEDEEYPADIIAFTGVIISFENRGERYPTMELKIELLSVYRFDEKRRQGLGDYIREKESPATIRFIPSSLGWGPYDSWDSRITREWVHYDCCDLQTIFDISYEAQKNQKSEYFEFKCSKDTHQMYIPGIFD